MNLSKSFVEEIRELIRSARTTVARGIDLVQVHTNFEIGRRIVEEEQRGKVRAAYGELVLKTLSERLTKEFGDGFSKRNLELMRRFYVYYAKRQSAITQTVSAQLPSPKKTQTPSAQSDKVNAPLPPAKTPFSLSWSHYVFLLSINNHDERSFYEIEATTQNWALRELKRQFGSSLEEKIEGMGRGMKKRGFGEAAESAEVLGKIRGML